jgi:hypothetical protein
VQFEETFVHRPQFFGVERRIIDAARRIAIPGKMADGAQQVAVGDHGSVEIDGRKQVAVERRRAQQRGQRRIAHDLAQRLQPQPEVNVIGEGAAAHQESPQPPDAIVRVVRVVADQPAIFGGQQEEHAVDDAQRLAIQRSGNVVRDGFARRRETKRGAQRHVRRVRQEAVRQDQQSLFHAVAQAVAHPSALFQRVLMVAFQPAVTRVRSGVRQARAVDQPVEHGEVGEALLIEDLRQVAFDIRLPPEVRAGVQQTQRAPVGDQPPHLLAAVEILLHQHVRRDPPSSAHAERTGRGAPQVLAPPDDMHRRGVVCSASAVRNGEARLVNLIRVRVGVQVVAEQTEERDDPGIAGDCGRRTPPVPPASGGVRGGARQAAAKDRPLRLGVGEDACDLIGQGARPVQPEIARLLPWQIAGKRRLQDVGIKQTAFETDRQHWCVDGMHRFVSESACVDDSGAHCSACSYPCSPGCRGERRLTALRLLTHARCCTAGVAASSACVSRRASAPIWAASARSS